MRFALTTLVCAAALCHSISSTNAAEGRYFDIEARVASPAGRYVEVLERVASPAGRYVTTLEDFAREGSPNGRYVRAPYRLPVIFDASLALSHSCFRV